MDVRVDDGYWTEAHQREAFVRLCELAVDLCRKGHPGWAADLSDEAGYGSNDEACFRWALTAGPFDPASIDREVAIVRERAESAPNEANSGAADHVTEVDEEE